MIEGSRVVARPAAEVWDRLRMILAGANCEVEVVEEGRTLRFRHGTYLTQTSPMIPKTGTLRLSETDGGTRIHYTVQLSGFVQVWLILIASLTFCLIFPPILAYRALVVHPRRFMENLLAGV